MESKNFSPVQSIFSFQSLLYFSEERNFFEKFGCVFPAGDSLLY